MAVIDVNGRNGQNKYMNELNGVKDLEGRISGLAQINSS